MLNAFEGGIYALYILPPTVVQTFIVRGTVKVIFVPLLFEEIFSTISDSNFIFRFEALNPEPEIVTLLPAFPDVGDIDDIDGPLIVGGVTVNVLELLVP